MNTRLTALITQETDETGGGELVFDFQYETNVKMSIQPFLRTSLSDPDTC